MLFIQLKYITLCILRCTVLFSFPTCGNLIREDRLLLLRLDGNVLEGGKGRKRSTETTRRSSTYRLYHCETFLEEFETTCALNRDGSENTIGVYRNDENKRREREYRQRFPIIFFRFE